MSYRHNFIVFQLYKGEKHDFLFASLEDVALPNGVHSSRKEFARRGASIYFRMDPYQEERLKGKIVLYLQVHVYSFTFLLFIRSILAVVDLFIIRLLITPPPPPAPIS